MYAQYHIDMTESVLGRFFSRAALQQIISANLGQDSLFSLFSSSGCRHFCDEQIEESLAYIDEEHARIEVLSDKAAMHADSPEAIALEQRAALGRLLHTVQDFYAHSNYVYLWLQMKHEYVLESKQPIDGLDRQILSHPELRTARWLPWLEIGYRVPICGSLLRKFWLPPDSHEAMNLDSPQRGVHFAYAMIMAQQRTASEYRKAIQPIFQRGGRPALRAFYGTDVDAALVAAGCQSLTSSAESRLGGF